jgi:hypothetical protein
MGTNITGIGNANAIGFKSRVTGGTYFPPELKDALVGVWSAYGKSNDSTDRNIIKNKIKDKGGDFELVNFNYEGTSGYNGYPVVFGKDKTYQYVNHSPNYNQTTINVTHFNTRQALLYSYIQRNGELTSYNRDYPSYKIKVSGLEEGFGLMYQYNSKANATSVSILKIEANGIYTIPKSFASDGSLTNANVWIGFIFTGTEQEQCNVTIEVLPEYKGAVVTDGIDDMIVSQKSVQEMLGGSNEITVVSMAHFIKGESGAPKICRINQIRRETRSIRNSILEIGKSGIFGYTYKNGVTTINNILGDKNDCVAEGNLDGIVAPFSVEGYYYNNNSNPLELCSIAWYWTIIANKVLTTDQINQVIAYFNLDRTLKPDILCNTIKQGITNENHAEFGDKLIDFSGNGRDIQLNNIAWKLDSGIGKYEVDFSTWSGSGIVIGNGVGFKIEKETISWWGMYAYGDTSGLGSFTIKVTNCHDPFVYRYKDEDGNWKNYLIESDGIYTLPASGAKDDKDNYRFFNSNPNATYNGLTVEQIPSHAGALCFDGVNDFGKVTGMPVYKDYTVVADYERLKINIGVDSDSPILSKSESVKLGAFIFNTISSNGDKVSYSFGRRNIINTDDTIRKIFYQSKYINDGQDINIESTFVDSDKLWLGTYRDSDYRFIAAAIYSLMSFPYSMSEFLIERQLKKHKLGTLYPDMVEFRPIVKSNSEYQVVDCYIDTLPAVVGNYYPINSKLRIAVTTKGAADEVTSLTVNGVSLGTPSVNGNRFTFNGTLSDKSPQKINITIDEYIRFEDIVQPYPSLFTLINYDTEEVYSWGSKLKIGAKFNGNVANLLPDMYEWQGDVLYNGEPIYWNTTPGVVAKEMVFSWNMPFKYLKTNAPKCIFSPSKLRIPNESYRYLGYIPDISGNGNHGVFNNFAFSKMSGADGYPYDYKSTSDFVAHARNAVLVNSETVKFINVSTQTSFYYKGTSYKGKIKVTGITKAIASGKVRYLDIYSNSPTNNDRVIIDKDGIYDVNIETEDAINIFFYLTPIVSGTTTLDEPVYLEQVGNYEGSICFDGVDDYMDIPSLSIGGKQVLMKTNWLKSPTLLYDQRASGSFAILTTKEDDATNPRIAYQARNQDGKTYIDGIENNYIETYSLKGITHNITVTNPSAGSGVVPVIGANTGKSSSFAKMALYDFMLFDEVSTDEEIKQLNDIVGIEGGYVQKPPYYWDAYGKTNLDADKATIQQRGVAVGDYDLTNTNFAYDKMSGFGGYTLGKFTNSWSLSNNSNSISIVARNPYDITLKKLGGNSDWEFNTTELKLTSNPVSVKFKSDKNIRFTCDYHYYTVGGNSEGAPLGITSKDLIANEDTIITISPISQENIDKYNIDINRGYYLIYFQLSPTLAVNEEVTIEMLPLYPNGLVYDGVDDYSENTSIPAFTDYTYIFKRTLLNKKYNSASVFKGSNQQSGGGAFICDYNSVEPELMIQGYSFGAGLYANSLNTNDIVYGTKNSVNGQTITSGNNADTEGLTIGKWRAYKQMVFYKLMLYPRTTDMLTINMIKNMMAEDGIIDIQGKLFTDKYTGDFNLDFNKDFLIGN